MTKRSFELYHYQIPVDSQVILRNRFLKVREGLLVKVQCGEHIGWGEIAPLPEFSQETLTQAKEQAKAWLYQWHEARSHNGEFLPMDDLYPSVAFGLSCALFEMRGKLQEKGCYESAPLCFGDPDELYAKLGKMTGEKIGKIKVGLYEANRDGMITDMLLEAIPDLAVRLDANRSWTKGKAQMFAKYVHPDRRARIQFLEEPCKSPQESLEFAEETGIRIAWDETVREKDFNLQKNVNVAGIVIKPTLVGSLEKCVQLIQQAHEFGMLAVISSSMESSFALTQLARISAQYTPCTVPGLDTLNLMDYQLVRPWPGCNLPLLSLDNTDFIQCIEKVDF